MKNERAPASRELRRETEVDMSPEAIDRRLRDVGQLYKLGMSLGRARRIGKVVDVASSKGNEASSVASRAERIRE